MCCPRLGLLVTEQAEPGVKLLIPAPTTKVVFISFTANHHLNKVVTRCEIELGSTLIRNIF
jgi:hypothetical protein